MRNDALEAKGFPNRGALASCRPLLSASCGLFGFSRTSDASNLETVPCATAILLWRSSRNLLTGRKTWLTLLRPLLAILPAMLMSPLTLLFQCFDNPDPEEQVWRLHVLLVKVQSQLTSRLRARDLAGDPSESWDERELVATALTIAVAPSRASTAGASMVLRAISSEASVVWCNTHKQKGNRHLHVVQQTICALN